MVCVLGIWYIDTWTPHSGFRMVYRVLKHETGVTRQYVPVVQYIVRYHTVQLPAKYKSPFGSTKKLCISPITLHFWDAVYFDLFQSVRRHEKYSVLVKMQSFTYSTFYCNLKCSAFSPNSAFGNAEFENTVSAERTLKNRTL
jgi:hypothetical protein